MKKLLKRSITVYLFPILILIISSLTLSASNGDIQTVNLSANSVSYPVIDTGITDYYDNSDEITYPNPGEAFYGQDALYVGIQPSYQDNDDGTVTDLNTGLMWQQTPSNIGYSWNEALTYCDDLVLAGYDDWRTPTLKELFSISAFESGWPYLDTDYFDIAGFEVSKDEQYWSSNYYFVGTTHGDQETAFGVNHGTGHIKGYPIDASGPMGNYVRAVRGDEYGINSFVDNSNGTITDSATDLMWQTIGTETTLDWEDALAYAENLELGGFDDWRLPNVKELQSLVDYSGVFPAINPLFNCSSFINEGGYLDYGYYWTGTSAYFGPDAPDYYYAWYVAFGYGIDGEGEDMHGAGCVRFDTKVEDGPAGECAERVYNYIRCVRGGVADIADPVETSGFAISIVVSVLVFQALIITRKRNK